MSDEAREWKRIVEWLKANAPVTHASLMPPIEASKLRAALEPLGRPVPKEILSLYALAGGQKSSPGSKAVGIFRGYWFMPLDGVDGIKQAWADWEEAREGGAEWATVERFPFAKDFGGSYLCIEQAKRADAKRDGDRDSDRDRDRDRDSDNDNDSDDDDDALVVVAGDDDSRHDYDCKLSTLLSLVESALREKSFVIDERVIEYDTHVVQFDATKARQVGEIARHSVFDALGIQAIVEDVRDHVGMFEEKPSELYGLAFRLVSPHIGHEDVLDFQLTDNTEEPIRGPKMGKGSGGGRPGIFVYVMSKRPLPPRSRLRVTFRHPKKP